MTDRFADLKKIPNEPALRLLALANARLKTRLSSPAAAPVSVVLDELEKKGAVDDMLRLLSAALPPRECIWWGCLAAGDLVDADEPMPKPLAAARNWVFKPDERNRAAARAAVEGAGPEDDTTLVATAVAMCDGKLGTGDLAAFDAPLGATATFVFALNVKSLGRGTPETFVARGRMLVDRALDIARGGNGQHIQMPIATSETAE